MELPCRREGVNRFFNSYMKCLAALQIFLSIVMAHQGMKDDALLASVDACFFWMVSNG